MKTIPISSKNSDSTHLIERFPSESVYEKIFPFSSDQELKENYINFFGSLRLGKLLEDLDLTAGLVAYEHTQGWDKGLRIVTAACDRIDLLGELASTEDLQLLASVNWVGNSSLEIGIRISSWNNSHWHRVARAYFIMVARHEGKSIPVNSLKLFTKEDLRRFKEGRKRQIQRRELAQRNYYNQAPSDKEIAQLHALFLKIRDRSIKGIPMSETCKHSTILMHPQCRNIHNNIFGGYLMREAFELAWNITYLYCKNRPQFLSVDHMYFYQPVEIGSILSFTGIVIYNTSNKVMVEITTEVINPYNEDIQITNVCYFTFSAFDDKEKVSDFTTVLPHSYEEGLKYLEGSRRFSIGEKYRSSNNVR